MRSDKPLRGLRLKIALPCLVVLLGAVGTLLGYAARVRYRAAVQEDMVAAIKQHGGHVAYDYDVQGDTTPPGHYLLRWTLGQHAFAPVRHVVLTSKVEDAMSAMSTAFPGLMSMTLRCNALSQASVQQLIRCPSLERVALIENAMITQTVDPSVQLAATADDESVRAIAHVVQLRELSIRGLHFSTEPLDGLRRLVNLRRLQLCDITQAGPISLDFLSHIQSLRALEISNVEFIAEDTLARPGRLTCLESVVAYQTPLSDAMAQHLLALPALESIDLSYTGISSKALKNLGACGKLKRLTLRGTNVDDDAAVALAQGKAIERLDVAETQITDKGLCQLSSLASLRVLVFSFHRGVTQEGISSLRRALPNCRIVGFATDASQ